mmetsp:Transcript_10299/g.23532  ORF Transcript_10299/g.23532 Transcript_10299/m.23532 type:complete len:206 (-) Transcript_10299:892-1509(-)
MTITAAEYSLYIFFFSWCWLSVSVSAFTDVFVFAKERGDILTATEEFRLNPSTRAAVYSSFYLGWLFGDPFFGWIADKWGRHPSVYIATTLGLIFQASCALAVGPYSLFSLRLFAGVCMVIWIKSLHHNRAFPTSCIVHVWIRVEQIWLLMYTVLSSHLCSRGRQVGLSCSASLLVDCVWQHRLLLFFRIGANFTLSQLYQLDCS